MTDRPPPTQTLANQAEEAEADQEIRSTAAGVVDAAQSRGGAKPGLRVGGAQLAELVEMALAALRAGWQADVLAERVGGDLVSAKSVFGALRFRLRPENLGPPPATAPAPVQRQPCLQGCTEGTLMFGVTGVNCPTCRPGAFAKQLRTTSVKHGRPVESLEDLVAVAMSV